MRRQSGSIEIEDVIARGSPNFREETANSTSMRRATRFVDFSFQPMRVAEDKVSPKLCAPKWLKL